MKVVHILGLLLCLGLAGGCQTVVPQNSPATELSDDPSVAPSSDSSEDFSADYSDEPTYDPTIDPSEESVPDPSCEISLDPTDDPSHEPTDDPSELSAGFDVGIDGWEDDSEDYGGDVYD